MGKKSSVLSRPEKLVSVKAEDILGKPLNRAQRSMLKRLQVMPDSDIDYSDIPALTDEQLKTAAQPNRQLTAVRLDRDVLAWLKGFGPGYSTRINNILRVVMENSTLPPA